MNPDTHDGTHHADEARTRAALLAHIRHELSAPINAIIGYSEMLIDGTGSGDGDAAVFRPDLEKIYTAGQQLRARVSELLHPARTETPDLDLDSFGTHVRHELRTPINAVIGYSEMLIEDAADAPEHAEFVADLQKTQTAARQLLELIEDIVRFSDLEANSANLCPASADVSSMIANLVSTIHAIDDAHTRVQERGGRVLVVDDSETNRDILARRLAREGYEVECVADGAEALSSVAERKFDLVLLDIMMPGLNGYQVLERLKASAELRDIPVIMISALDELDSIVRCIEMGAEDYLPKPFNPVILRARVEASMEKKRLRDREQAYLAQLRVEREKSERLLLNILPAAIAERLKEEQGIIAESFTEATILFADVVGFTQMSARITPVELVYLLNEIFSSFDELAARHRLEKIKTIGDAYMVAAGLPERRADHAEAMAEMALDMQDALARFNRARVASLDIRTGINTGPVVAGIIGTSKFIYDLWGDAVNTASRMESHSTPGRIQVTEATYEHLRDAYRFEPRGAINVKGKGDMPTYFLLGRK
ncbi:MAG TPA: adenylate/guanylate cyclase domain-containing protein [Pyrinomonadaceae bacterium]|nr:adenylate/guanylate cyclase domain-containing protein [Pyrinomonadaceae bacterium]